MKYVYLSADNWSDSISPKWKPPKGLFTESATKIADILYKNSVNLKQAMSRLNFYINRAGYKFDDKDKKRLENAKIKLKDIYHRSTTH